MAKKIRDWTGKIGPAQAKRLEVLELGNGGLYGSIEVREVSEKKGFKVRKVANFRGDLAGETIIGEQGEGNDTVGIGMAFKTVPITAISVGVP